MITISITLAHLLMPRFARGQVTRYDLDGIAQRLVEAAGLPFSGIVIPDPYRSQGYASIQFNGRYATIFVEPRIMPVVPRNTWAFVLAHELAHQALGHYGAYGPEAEADADVTGAQFAVGAGFDVVAYINDLYEEPNSCSPSHGCWHTRARQLELAFNIDTGHWRSTHDSHASGDGPFRYMTLPDTRPLREYHVACRHTVPCVHVVRTYWGPRQMHSCDVLHDYDVIYQ